MKRLLSLILALCLILALVPTASAEAPEVFRYDEQITLKVSVFDRGATGQTPVDNNYWTEWIQKEFGDPRNIKMEWSVIPRSEEVDKLNILMASGEAADICFTYTEGVITNFVQQGGLVELTVLINEHGQNLKAYLGEKLLSYGMFEGGQYAVPAKRVVLATQGMFIREDWLEKLGLSMPKTKEEFYNALVAFRDQNPGGAEKVIPYAMGYDMTAHNMLRLSFIKNLDEKTLATTPDVMWDGYEDYVLFLNKLYNEGLISPDFALDNADLILGDVTSGVAGGYTYNYDHPLRVSPGVLSALQAQEPGAKLSPLNCFESVIDGKYYHESYAPNGLFSFVPIYSQHPEAAVMYLDWLTQLPTLNFLQFGEAGVHHELNEEGIPVMLDVQDDRKYNSMQNIDFTLLTNGQEFGDESMLVKVQSLSYQGYADLFEPLYTIANEDLVITNFHFDVIIPSDALYNTSLTQFKRELLTKSTMAAPEDCSKVFAELRDQYMRDGGQAIMDEKIVAWDNAHK